MTSSNINLNENTRALLAMTRDIGRERLANIQTKGYPSWMDSSEQLTILRDNPFALLVAFGLNGQVRADDAWHAPARLEARGVPMDPRWIKDNPQRVVGAMMASPAIHRHRTASAATVVRAAQRVVGRYESDAAKIWNDQPTGQQLYNRFVAFHGFGPKKASFATIFLSGSMFVPVRRMDEAEPTVDFRVERFMHLTGIVPSCDHDLIRMAIRRAMPADGPDRDTWYSEVDRGMWFFDGDHNHPHPVGACGLPAEWCSRLSDR